MGKRHVRLRVWGGTLNGGGAAAIMVFLLCLLRSGSRAGKDKKDKKHKWT
jgi:hypothetical protein